MTGSVTERHVQAAWYDCEIRPAHLVTRRGSEVRVVHPGDWNLGAGPDFRNAVLEVGPERRRVRGDVEVHLSPMDWEAHGHGRDPAYRNVIAHVTWLGGPEPPSLPPGSLSIWLGRFLTAEGGFTTDRIDVGAYPYSQRPLAERPCRASAGSDPDRAAAVLEEAGRRRLEQKAARVRRILGGLSKTAAGAGPDVRRELFYREVMNALGYVKNAGGFRHVARAVPLGCVVAEPENAAAAFLTAAEFAEWNRVNVRPWNSPERRLVAAAEILTQTEMLTLVGANDFSRRGCRDMVAAMTDGHHLGKGRAAAILANVVAPFAYAEGRLKDIPAWLPPEDVSQPVRLMAFRFFGRDHNPVSAYANNGLRIQGLLEIFRSSCESTHPDCDSCRFGRRDGVDFLPTIDSSADSR